MAAAPELKLGFKGLYTSPNAYSAAPPGAARVADNVRFYGADLVGPRRGFQLSGPALPGAYGTKLTRLTDFNGTRVAMTDTGRLVYLVNGTWTSPDASVSFGPYGGPVRFFQANKSLFVLTSAGVKKLDALGSSLRLAGNQQPFGGVQIAAGVLPGAWFPTGYSAAYRYVFGRYDANGYLLLSAPSEPIVYDNTSGVTKLPQVVAPLPRTLDTSYFVQVFRTQSVPTGTDTGDEMFQVAEKQLKASDFNFGQFGVFDYSTDLFLGSSPLYTNPNTGGGIESANDSPPLAGDAVTYKRRTLYFNTTSKQRTSLALIGVGSPNGLQIGDVITVSGVTFTGAAAENILNNEFLVSTSGTAAQNIEKTARSLCYILSTRFAYSPELSAVPISAHYESGYLDNPGLILFEESGMGGAAFNIQASAHGDTAWSPQIDTAYYSDNDRRPAGLFWSHDGLPEAVPLDNNLDVGDANSPILRAVATTDAVYIWKTDGLWQLSGETPGDWVVRQIDASAILAVPDSAVVLNNAAMALTSKGAVAANASGLTPIGLAVQEDLEVAQLAKAGQGWALPYESQSEWLLALPSGVGDASQGQQYVFTTRYLGWTRWTIGNANHGVVGADGLLYLAVGNQLWQERKTRTSLDMVDPTGAIPTVIEWLPAVATGPLMFKDWRDAYFAFREATFTASTVGFASETSLLDGVYSQGGMTGQPWGNFAWGQVPWGGRTKPVVLHQDIPRDFAQSSKLVVRFSVSEANAFWLLEGVGLVFDSTGLWVTR